MIDYNNKSIVAFGCSVTHGCELVSGAYDPENIPGSFPNQLASRLNIACENLALPGGSNEEIIHRIYDHELSNRIVVVCWTSLIREYWHADGRHWFFIPNWGACFDNLQHKFIHIDERNPRIVAEDKEMLPVTSDYYDFFMQYKTDEATYLRKMRNYQRQFHLLMAETQTPYIELSCIYNNLPGVKNIDGVWTQEGRHPDQEEHLALANQLYNEYFRQ